MRIADPQIEREIAQLGPWFHNLHLPDGTQTAPGHRFGDFPKFKWQKVAKVIPEDLRGWSVLDIGCNAGFYSIELARRGADVLGIDVEPLYLRQAMWAAKQWQLDPRIRFMHGDVYHLLNARRTFDLVWFTGVFYHLRYPMLALDLVRKATRRMMMFQSMTAAGGETPMRTPENLPLDGRDRMREDGWPKMAFIEHSVDGDPTNWWAPDHACVEALLRSAGFRIRARPDHEFYFCEAAEDPHWGDLQSVSEAAHPGNEWHRADVKPDAALAEGGSVTMHPFGASGTEVRQLRAEEDDHGRVEHPHGHDHQRPGGPIR
jgi:tRNA (mo5U34)-methyltransferase